MSIIALTEMVRDVIVTPTVTTGETGIGGDFPDSILNFMEYPSVKQFCLL